MISLDMKNETPTKTSSSPLSMSTPDDEPKLSFSQLLKGESEKKDGKVIQNGALLLALGTEEKEVKGSPKNGALLALLKNDEELLVQKEEPVELHPKLTSSLSAKEIKTLVKEAKDFLKGKIEGSDEFKKSQIKELPKTLKGLATVAKKLGIDITKITVEDVKIKSELKAQPSNVKDILQAKMLTEEKKEVKVQPSHVKDILQAKNIKDEKKEVKVQTSGVKGIVQASSVIEEKEVEVKPVQVKDVKEDKEVEVKPTHVKENKELKVQPTHLKEVKEDKEVKVQASPIKETLKVADTKEVSHKEQKIDEKLSQIPKEIKATPLFKAQAVVEHTTTEQIVQVRANSLFEVEQKTPRDRADETLKLLLRGEKPAMSNVSLTADFSVATAKVIAPSAASDAAKSLEQLLHGESSSSSEHVTSKSETITTHKADAFEVKLNEAKQMIKYLSADVKTAIEDYKSPFTRVKVQLNPQRLGEVDLTVVQRGKNLHVNISSNNSAINTLVMNANELKVQLSNSGINNATLNFNNSSQNNDSNASQQQQNRQQEQQAHEEYNYFESEEANEEIISSLEIVVPQYG